MAKGPGMRWARRGGKKVFSRLLTSVPPTLHKGLVVLFTMLAPSILRPEQILTTGGKARVGNRPRCGSRFFGKLMLGPGGQSGVGFSSGGNSGGDANTGEHD